MRIKLSIVTARYIINNNKSATTKFMEAWMSWHKERSKPFYKRKSHESRS